MLCKVLYPGEFVAWVTCLIKEYEDSIVTGMVLKGYQIGAAAIDGKLSTYKEGTPSVVVAFTIKTRDENKQAKDIYKDLVDVLEEKKILYYSIVITAHVDSTWNSSNIVLPKKSIPPPLPTPEPNKKLN